MLGRWRSCAHALVGDRRGVAAIEFAIIAPLLLSLYFVTMEVSQGIETNKKVSRVGSMVADLITQQQTITKSEIDAIMKIGEAILQPYNRSVGKIVITQIEVTDEATPKVRVVWSRKLVNGTASVDAPKDAPTTVPTALKVKGTFLIRVQSDLDYKPVIVWAATSKPTLGLAAAFDGIAMSETYYLRPRMSASIPCSDC
ncbi:Flp pilus assembly protein TadG [Aminobacter aminovorans]|jgi:Flp pilus assembly protein TadG|uniref:Flp pilus assembly protein TadG n=1 Tax=Aminobacter aminovorans TaxID=83263 RepID=A0A380WU52_AMIAI|nr:TadE/TadG family type IV pilus assembly protein [Aminobacter aminovorans]TCS23698.1 Flp pilus assembly protein TadG [Aminobacter aminovorans]SUU91664.1 Flp pilus assembly protein TadG [Aminobacter aminovorans]